MADTFLGTAEGRIRTTYDGRGTKAAKADIEGVGVAGEKSRKGMAAFAKGSAVAGALLVGAFALAVKTSADFEKQISAVGAVSGATDVELGKIRETALRIGKDTKFSASEAAVAMEELAKAGVSTTDILGGAADATVALAAAGGVELPMAATIASNAMNAFGLSAKELPKVADLIAGAANASAIDVGEFGQSLQQAGAVAHTVGVPFADLTTAIALLGNAGIKGSDAGTSLKTMLQNLNPQTAKQKDLMKELGIVTADGANRFFDASGNIKSMADVSQVLQDSLSGMTKQQKLATLETLFGSDAIRAASIMADAGAKGFDELATNIGKTKAADVAAKRMDNLAGSVEQFKGSVETALIIAGAPFQTGLRQIVDLGTKLVNAFANLSPQTQKIIGQFIAFGGVALLLAAGVAKASVAFAGMGRGLATFGKAMLAVGKAARFLILGIRAISLALLANPFGIALIAIVALAAGLILLYRNSETFRKAVQTGWAAIMGVIRNVALAFKALFAAFSGEGITTEAGTLVGTFERIGVAARGVYENIRTFIGQAVAFFAAAWRSVQPIVAVVWAFITTTIRNGIAIITGIFKLFAALLTGNWTAAWNALKGIVGAVLNQIGNVIRTIIGLILANWRVWGANMVSALASWVGSVLGAIGRFAAALPGRILYAIGFIIGRWIRFQVEMIAGAIRLGSQVLSAITRFLAQLPGRVIGFISRTGNAFNAFVGRMIAAAIRMGGQVLAAVGRFFSQLPGRVSSAVNAMISAFGRLPGQLINLASQAGNGATRAISAGLNAIPGIVSGVVGRAISAFTGMVGRAFSAAQSMASSLWNGFKSGLGIGSPSHIERAMWQITGTVEKELARLKAQSASIKRVSKSLVTDAARALAHLGKGGSIFEDFSFRGMPKGFDNEALAKAFYKANPGFDFGSRGTNERVKRFLQQMLAQDKIAARKQALISSRANSLLLKQHAAMLKMASAVPLESGVLRVVTASAPGTPAAGGTIGQQNIYFNISGMRDAEDVRSVLTSSSVLRPLASAARARGGGGAY